MGTLDETPAKLAQYHPSRVLTFAYQSFALGTLSILAYKEAKINTRKRNLFGYGMFFISSLLVLILNATSRKGGNGTFIRICAISAAFGLVDAHVQRGMVGDLSFMTPELVQQGLYVPSTLRLITKATSKNSANGLRKGASSLGRIQTVSSDLAAAGIQTLPKETDKQFEQLSNKELLLQNVDYAIDMFLIYVLTLSIFPGFLSEDTRSHNLWTCALFHGQILWLWMDDNANVGLGFNKRLLHRLCPYAPKGYKGPEQNALGNLLVLFLSEGIFVGVILNWLWLIGKGW
ncbi:hypothetical protein QYF36_022953 [Acer negundo]|nr:hypothetical protein QYF36_022953 [Acer negundo]